MVGKGGALHKSEHDCSARRRRRERKAHEPLGEGCDEVRCSVPNMSQRYGQWRIAVVLHVARCAFEWYMRPGWRTARRDTLHCTALHCTALHCTALHCTALHCTALHCQKRPKQSVLTADGLCTLDALCTSVRMRAGACRRVQQSRAMQAHHCAAGAASDIPLGRSRSVPIGPMGTVPAQSGSRQAGQSVQQRGKPRA